MENQQPQNENLLSFDEAKAAIEKDLASIIGTLSINNALLEKKLMILDDVNQQLTASEAGLVKRIDELKAEIASLPDPPLSEKAATLAEEGRKILQGDSEKEKAAPAETA